MAGLALIVLLWSTKAGEKNSNPPSDSDESVIGKTTAVSASPHPIRSDSQEQHSSSMRDETARSQKEKQKALEGAIAAQEEIIEEKRASLARFIRSNAVIYQPSENKSAEKDSAPVDSRASGYVDMKKDYELEVENLERLKRRLDEL